MRSIPSPSLTDAQRLADAAIAKAEELGVAVVVTVLDTSAQTQLVLRMDGAPLMSASIAHAKAHTVVGMGGAPSSYWEQAGQDNPSLAGSIVAIPGFMPFGGGEPLLHDDQLVGAIGISGGTVEQDVTIAQVGAAALSSLGGNEA